jgi:hypothetical protein
MLYGVALRGAGHDEDAQLELRAALTAFQGLGASADARKAAGFLAGPAAKLGVSSRAAATAFAVERGLA